MALVGLWFAAIVLASGLFFSASRERIWPKNTLIIYGWYKGYIRYDINDPILINDKIYIQCYHIIVSCVDTESKRKTSRHTHTQADRDRALRVIRKEQRSTIACWPAWKIALVVWTARSTTAGWLRNSWHIRAFLRPGWAWHETLHSRQNCFTQVKKVLFWLNSWGHVNAHLIGSLY